MSPPYAIKLPLQHSSGQDHAGSGGALQNDQNISMQGPGEASSLEIRVEVLAVALLVLPLSFRGAAHPSGAEAQAEGHGQEPGAVERPHVEPHDCDHEEAA